VLSEYQKQWASPKSCRATLIAAILLSTCCLGQAQRTVRVTPASSQAEETRSLPVVRSRAEFDSLAVVYDANTPYALPHVLFAIDRQNGNRILR